MYAIISSLSLSAGLGGAAGLAGVGWSGAGWTGEGVGPNHDCHLAHAATARASPAHANTTIILQY